MLTLQPVGGLGLTVLGLPVSGGLWLLSWHSWFRCCPGCHLEGAGYAPCHHLMPASETLPAFHLHFGFGGWPAKHLMHIITWTVHLLTPVSWFFFSFYLILNSWYSIGCNLIPRCRNINGLTGKTPNRKHILSIGRDNPRVWNVNNSVVFFPRGNRSYHLPSVWTRQLDGWHICCLGVK